MKHIFKDEAKKSVVMDTIVESNTKNLQVDDLIEGNVLAIEKSAVFVDLHGLGTGIIYGVDFLQAKEIIKKISIGDTVKAKVVATENEEGYIELSLKEAKQAIIWSEAVEIIKNKTSLSLNVKEANKGGLIIDWQGIQGFLPASQLSNENYPKAADGDKDAILKALKGFVGKKVDVNILVADPREGKLIFTQRGGEAVVSSVSAGSKEKMSIKYETGNVVEGTITGVVDFGVFVKFDDGVEGLIHISEISWSLIDNPKNIYKPGERIKAKVIDVKDGKISLSIKALTENPWATAAARYKKGDSVSGVVIKFNKHGALISIEEGVAGLMHISEFGGEEQMKKALSLGKICHCFISLFEPKEERMTLSLKETK